ncbi:MAG TPA: sigma-54-dependent Fis family transcriptional regulator [Deltaproteobacteria bacterium]|nr:sigma-54-dependent Fis family transcriptional regulator [Deltaproteobacteria bacterium]
MEKRPVILVVDDEGYTRKLLSKLLGSLGYDVLTAVDGPEALRKFEASVADLVMLDQRMPGMDGLTVLRRIKELDPAVAVIMMTGYGTVEEAVKAMKLGAYDYLAKPFDNVDEVELTVKRALKDKFLSDENRYLKERLDESLSFDAVVGRSKAMRRIIDLIKKVAPLDSTVLLHGETGTGKELIAQTIHQNSPRASRRFVAVNCGSLSESLLESTLFGYEKGAFTGAVKTTTGYFEAADGGTLFLDEITGTSLKLQTSLLRVLQEREFTRLGDTVRRKTDFRLITAANVPMEEEIAAGRFREDLYYRINVIPIEIPPLRERREDIALLARYFLDRFREKLGKDVGPFTAGALAAMEAYEWRGNVRELENMVERVVALKGSGPIDAADLPPHVTGRGGAQDAAAPESYSAMPFQEAKETFERLYIEDVLKRVDGNVSKAAEITGIRRQNLYLKLKKYGLR